MYKETMDRTILALEHCTNEKDTQLKSYTKYIHGTNKFWESTQGSVIFRIYKNESNLKDDENIFLKPNIVKRIKSNTPVGIENTDDEIIVHGDGIDIKEKFEDNFLPEVSYPNTNTVFETYDPEKEGADFCIGVKDLDRIVKTAKSNKSDSIAFKRINNHKFKIYIDGNETIQGVVMLWRNDFPIKDNV